MAESDFVDHHHSWGEVMNIPDGCLSQGTFEPLGPPTSGEIRGGVAAPVYVGPNHNGLDLLQRAAEMMATGSVTEDQARLLSRQFQEFVH
jgi:hypothetical protein